MRPFVWMVIAAGFCTAFLTAPVHAFRLAGADFQLQTVKRHNQTAISGLALRARLDDVDLPVGLMLMPMVERWKDKSSVEFVGIEAMQTDLAVGIDAAYQWDWGAWSPYLGAGLATHFIAIEANAPSLGLNDAQDTLTKVGPDFLLGVDMPGAAGVRSTLEFKYQYISDYEQFKFNWGLTVAF